MSALIGRRHFLKVCGASAVALATVSKGVIRAANTAHYALYGFDEERFGEETLLTQAVGIAVARIQNQRIWQNTYNVASFAHCSGTVMARSNVVDDQANRWNLLWNQLDYLSRPNGPNDTEPPFPNIRIRARSDPNGRWLGKAKPDLVTLTFRDEEVRQSGEFDITLNRFFVAGGGIYSDPEEWASTIVHEMLHNLGHLHPTDEDALSDKYQINACNNAILCNGYYKNPRYRSRSAHHLCGGHP